jgi:hypothetical protein
MKNVGGDSQRKKRKSKSSVYRHLYNLSIKEQNTIKHKVKCTYVWLFRSIKHKIIY